MKRSNVFLATTAILSLATTTVMAQSLGNISADVKIGLGVINNMDGGFGLESYSGIEDALTRGTFALDSSFGMSAGAGLLQFDLNAEAFATPSSDDDDATSYLVDIGVHYSRPVATMEIGGFVGVGIHDDNGDSDDAMGYWFAGIEARKNTSFGQIFGAIGYFDSYDEYNEGTQNAIFVRAGADYNLNEQTSLMGALGYSAGDKSFSALDNTTITLELGAERQFSDTLSGFVSYQLDQVYFDASGTNYGDTFHTLTVGVHFGFGGGSHSTWSTPDFGRWVAFNANEIE